MAKAEIFSGNCGFITTVETTMNGKTCGISFQSECRAIQRLAEDLTQLEPLDVIH